MFAEQLQSKPPALLFPSFGKQHERASMHTPLRIGEGYKKDVAPEKTRQHTDVVRQFDLGHSFKGLNDLIERFGKERGLFQCVLGVMLNIWSLRQEMLGTMDTQQVVTLVSKNKDGLTFRNDLYGQARDLEAMYLRGIEDVGASVRPRYMREVEQTIHVFRSLTHTLQHIDFSLPKPQLRQQLELNGFHEEEIDVSPAMIAGVGSLRERIRSVDDLTCVMREKPTLRAFVGPAQHVSVSPPHWSHHRGETGFVWASECVVLPETGEIFIRQNGKFGKTDDEHLLPYLAYGNREAKTFQSEAELMEYINTLMEAGYRQPKVLLDFLVKNLGGLEPVGKIDRNIQEGELDIRPYFAAVEQLFEFELAHISTGENPEVRARLGAVSDLMKHQIARNQSKALPGIVNQYIATLGAEHAPMLSTFLENLSQHALRLDSGFRIPIDFSLLDCVTNPIGYMKFVENIGGQGGINKLFGKGAQELLHELEKSGITTRAQLHEFCTRFGLDERTFTNFGVCRNTGPHFKCTCSQEQFLGPCFFCPMCEAKYKLMNMGIPPSDLDSSLSPTESLEDKITQLPQRMRQSVKTTLSTALANVANPRLLRAA